MSLFIIGEAGSCHDGSPIKALQLIELAAKAGAGAVKFQYYSSPERLAERRRLGPDAVEMYRKYQLPLVWLPTLRDYAVRLGLEFMCTVYLDSDVQYVAPHVSRFKIASLEALDERFVRLHLDGDGREVLISTGAMDGAGIAQLRALRTLHTEVRLLHCVSAYPAAWSDLNLGAIRAYGLDGFSDHSGRVETGGLAVAAGAKILEVHFRLWDTSGANPDYPHSVPSLSDYIECARRAAEAMGDGIKRIMPGELALAGHRAKD